MADDLVLVLGEDDEGLAARLGDEIVAFNVEATGFDDGRDLRARVVDGQGELVAGLSGWTWGGTCFVDLLWVRADRRGRGLGTRLMDVAEQEAVARGCEQVVLVTHTFQAPGFYEQRGFVEAGRIEGYPLGHAQVQLVKVLPRA
jgi:ribosomal protein S18 acetylase RimI-like enzyme